MKKSKDVFEAVIKQLQDQRNEGMDSKKEAYVFLCMLKQPTGQLGINASVGGEENGLIQTFMHAIGNSPKPLQKAFLIAAANILAKMDGNEASVISYKLGTYVEKTYGHVNCTCEKCRASLN